MGTAVDLIATQPSQNNAAKVLMFMELTSEIGHAQAMLVKIFQVILLSMVE